MRLWIALVALAALWATAHAKAESRYRILSDDRFETRRVIAVELAGRITRPELAHVSDAIKVRDRHEYARVIINFYLPSMSLGDGSWATVSYTPQQATVIRGITREEELAFIKQAHADKRKRVGTWLATSSAIKGAVTIFKDQGKLYVEWTLKTGIKTVEEVTESRTWRGRRFDLKRGSYTYFLINTDNQLEIRDTKGLIATGETMRLRGARQHAGIKAHRYSLGLRHTNEATVEQVRAPVVTNAPPAAHEQPASQAGRYRNKFYAVPVAGETKFEAEPQPVGTHPGYRNNPNAVAPHPKNRQPVRAHQYDQYGNPTNYPGYAALPPPAETVTKPRPRNANAASKKQAIGTRAGTAGAVFMQNLMR